jgi:hypothetical protein
LSGERPEERDGHTPATAQSHQSHRRG